MDKEDKMAALSAIRNNEPNPNASAANLDMKIEVVVIPVSDVDRAKEFYSKLGWRLDADFTVGNDWTGVQFTPPGSGCSVIFGKNVTTAAPGSAQGLYLAVTDIESARKDLLRRGIEVSEVFHGSNVHTGTDEPYIFGRLRASGPDPAHTSYFSFASFRDPDGNGWLLQEITARQPGRGVGNLDVASMTELLRETEEHHGKYEPTAPKHHWSGWYAAYIVARQNGKTPEEAAQEGKLHIEGKLAA
jgi:catechol 2,3-dioxygenase-like lactoylglutathione lyase family enzyme